MKVGILTTFSNFNSEYSLTTVVQSQLRMLVKYGYNPVLFVLNIFRDEDKVPEGVEIRKIVPQLLLEPYGQHNLDSLDSDVEKARTAFEENMQDIDVMLCHDIIFINSYLPYNIALRQAIDTKLGNVKWLHWMHSGPSFCNLDGSVWDNLYTLPKNSRLIYMNYTDQLRAAEMYHTFPSNVRTVFNAMDIRDLYEFHPLSRELSDAYDLMSADIVVSYPLSSTRMDVAGKQLSKAIRVVAEIKKRGKSVRFIVPNAHANGQREKDKIEEMYQLAQEHGLERRELIFTSLHDKPKWEHGVPHEVVRDMFTLSNVFIFPSYSENCPLVLLEAMAGTNVLVLNQDFPAFKDFCGNDALYFRFSSTVAPEPQFPNGIDNYYRDVAILILNELEQNKAVKAQTRLRKEFNIDAIFRNQLEMAIKEITNGN
jgi:glycosyltransferase involved in cell wall biosynthesis